MPGFSLKFVIFPVFAVNRFRLQSVVMPDMDVADVGWRGFHGTWSAVNPLADLKINVLWQLSIQPPAPPHPRRHATARRIAARFPS